MTEKIKQQSKEYLELFKEYHNLTKSWIIRCYGLGVAWTVLLIASTALAFLPVSRLYFMAKYNEYKAVKATIELARTQNNDHEIELRGIQVVAVQWNGWLAYWKTWNEVPIVEFYIPDDIQKLEDIK